MKTKFLLFVAAFFLFSASLFAQNLKSVYTPLNAEKCKTLELREDQGGSYVGECRGAGGYKLRVTEGDLRQSVSVVAPGKKPFDLSFGSVSGGFSYVGETAEWRVEGKTPIALIVRFNANEHPTDAERKTSYLIVSKITKNRICIVDVIAPGGSQNILAQKWADAAATKPCKTFE